MRTSEEYLYLAAKFRAMAAGATEAILRTRYADLAECYRLVAEDRKRLIADGVIKPDPA